MPQVRDIVASALGVSGKTYEKANLPVNYRPLENVQLHVLDHFFFGLGAGLSSFSAARAFTASATSFGK